MRITGRTNILWFVLAILLSACSSNNESRLFSGGDGNVSNPYWITSLDDLNAIRHEENLNKHFIQVRDIDASASVDLQNGSGFQPIGTREQPFTGSYDGNGYTISALFIHNQKTGDNAVGLFGYVKNGLIENVTIDNQSPGWYQKINEAELFQNRSMVTVLQKKDVDLSNARGVGGLIGFNDGGIVRNSTYMGNTGGFISQGIGGFIGVNNGLVENSHFRGIASSGSAAGFAWINAGQIHNSSANGRASGMTAYGFLNINYGEIIKSYANMDINGSNGAAGFANRNNYPGVIYSSFVKGNLSGDLYIAGFVLTNNGDVQDVYSTTDLEIADFRDEKKIASIVVFNEENGKIENSYFAGTVEISGNSSISKAAIIENSGILGNAYWDTVRSGISDVVVEGNPEGATGLTTQQMTGPAAEANMPGFDWVNVWRTTVDGYSKLRWEVDEK